MLLFSSCKNDRSPETVKAGHAKMLVQYLLLDAFRQVLHVVPAYAGSGDEKGLTVRVDKSFENDDYPKVVTINYGGINKTDEFGINRRGKLSVTIADKEITKGSFRINFDEFWLNDSRLLGELNVNHSGGFLSERYDIVMEETCKLSNGNGVCSYSGEMQLNMVAGGNTFTVFDDLYHLIEKAKGQDFQRQPYESYSTSDYLADFSCRWILTSGQGLLNPLNEDDQNLDYGSGSCDGVVSIEVAQEQVIKVQVR